MNKRIGTGPLKGIPLLDKIGYGSGNFGIGVAFQAISSYLVFYATTVLGIPGSLSGLAISLSVVWDALTDPFMGYLSDRTRSRAFGRRHFYMLTGTIAIAITNYLLWNIDRDLSVMAKFTWLCISVILVKTFLTVFVTPYIALGAELSADYHERTSIQAIRTIFFLSGILFTSAIGMAVFFRATPEFARGQLNPAAYRNFGFAVSALMLLSGSFSFFSTKKYIPRLPSHTGLDEQARQSMRQLTSHFRAALRNRLFRYIVIGYLFTNIAVTFAGTLGLHVFTYTFELSSNGIAIAFGSLFLTSILSQPAWIALARRMDKKPAVMLSTTIASFGCLMLLVMVIFNNQLAGQAAYILPFSILTGFGIGGLFSIPLSMVADTIDVEEARVGIRSEGTFYGSMTFAYKISQSLAILLLGILLDLIRFNAELPVQTESTRVIMGVILAVGALISFIFTRISYSRYDLNRDAIEALQTKIKKQPE